MEFLIALIAVVIAISSENHNTKTVLVPTYVDYRCFNDEGEFDDSIGWDDLDCGNMWFIKKEVTIEKAGK